MYLNLMLNKNVQPIVQLVLIHAYQDHRKQHASLLSKQRNRCWSVSYRRGIHIRAGHFSLVCFNFARSDNRQIIYPAVAFTLVLQSQHEP